MGWARQRGGGGRCRRCPRRRKCADHLGGLGDARRPVLQLIPREESNSFSGQFIAALNDSCREQLHPALKDAGLKTPSDSLACYDVNPMVAVTHPKTKLWFYSLPQVGG